VYKFEDLVDCGFTIIFDGELGHVWTLDDHRGNLLKVFYNMDMRYSKIVDN